MAKQLIALLFILSAATVSFQTNAADTQPEPSSQKQIDTAKGVIERTAPGRSKDFVLSFIPKENGRDVFEISDAPDGKIAIAGSSGVAIASGFYHYIKNFCGCDISWCGSNIEIPSPLPKVGKKLRVATLHKFRVYFNYCTLNYTASWWHWDRWEKEIDFMALNGINMPLSVTGVEAVWYQSLLKTGFTD